MGIFYFLFFTGFSSPQLASKRDGLKADLDTALSRVTTSKEKSATTPDKPRAYPYP
jgi:hypothetical protein